MRTPAWKETTTTEGTGAAARARGALGEGTGAASALSCRPPCNRKAARPGAAARRLRRLRTGPVVRRSRLAGRGRGRARRTRGPGEWLRFVAPASSRCPKRAPCYLRWPLSRSSSWYSGPCSRAGLRTCRPRPTTTWRMCSARPTRSREGRPSCRHPKIRGCTRRGARWTDRTRPRPAGPPPLLPARNRAHQARCWRRGSPRPSARSFAVLVARSRPCLPSLWRAAWRSRDRQRGLR